MRLGLQLQSVIDIPINEQKINLQTIPFFVLFNTWSWDQKGTHYYRSPNIISLYTRTQNITAMLVFFLHEWQPNPMQIYSEGSPVWLTPKKVWTGFEPLSDCQKYLANSDIYGQNIRIVKSGGFPPPFFFTRHGQVAMSQAMYKKNWSCPGNAYWFLPCHIIATVSFLAVIETYKNSEREKPCVCWAYTCYMSLNYLRR